MKFISTGPASLYLSASEQLMKTGKSELLSSAQHIPEDETTAWQNNLDNWKSSRKRRQESVIEKLAEARRLTETNRKRGKTFDEILQSGRGRTKVVQNYADDGAIDVMLRSMSASQVSDVFPESNSVAGSEVSIENCKVNTSDYHSISTQADILFGDNSSQAYNVYSSCNHLSNDSGVCDVNPKSEFLSKKDLLSHFNSALRLTERDCLPSHENSDKERACTFDTAIEDYMRFAQRVNGDLSHMASASGSGTLDHSPDVTRTSEHAKPNQYPIPHQSNSCKSSETPAQDAIHMPISPLSIPTSNYANQLTDILSSRSKPVSNTEVQRRRKMFELGSNQNVVSGNENPVSASVASDDHVRNMSGMKSPIPDVLLFRQHSTSSLRERFEQMSVCPSSSSSSSSNSWLTSHELKQARVSACASLVHSPSSTATASVHAGIRMAHREMDTQSTSKSGYVDDHKPSPAPRALTSELSLQPIDSKPIPTVRRYSLVNATACLSPTSEGESSSLFYSLHSENGADKNGSSCRSSISLEATNDSRVSASCVNVERQQMSDARCLNDPISLVDKIEAKIMLQLEENQKVCSMASLNNIQQSSQSLQLDKCSAPSCHSDTVSDRFTQSSCAATIEQKCVSEQQKYRHSLPEGSTQTIGACDFVTAASAFSSGASATTEMNPINKLNSKKADNKSNDDMEIQRRDKKFKRQQAEKERQESLRLADLEAEERANHWQKIRQREKQYKEENLRHVDTNRLSKDRDTNRAVSGGTRLLTSRSIPDLAISALSEYDSAISERGMLSSTDYSSCLTNRNSNKSGPNHFDEGHQHDSSYTRSNPNIFASQSRDDSVLYQHNFRTQPVNQRSNDSYLEHVPKSSFNNNSTNSYPHVNDNTYSQGHFNNDKNYFMQESITNQNIGYAKHDMMKNSSVMPTVKTSYLQPIPGPDLNDYSNCCYGNNYTNNHLSCNSSSRLGDTIDPSAVYNPSQLCSQSNHATRNNNAYFPANSIYNVDTVVSVPPSAHMSNKALSNKAFNNAHSNYSGISNVTYTTQSIEQGSQQLYFDMSREVGAHNQLLYDNVATPVDSTAYRQNARGVVTNQAALDRDSFPVSAANHQRAASQPVSHGMTFGAVSADGCVDARHRNISMHAQTPAACCDGGNSVVVSAAYGDEMSARWRMSGGHMVASPTTMHANNVPRGDMYTRSTNQFRSSNYDTGSSLAASIAPDTISGQRVHQTSQPQSRGYCPSSIYDNSAKHEAISPHQGSNEFHEERILSVSGRKLCSHCDMELGRGAAMIIESLSLCYHLACFRCCVCGLQLGNGTAGADVRVRNDKLHCHDCYSSEDGVQFSKV